MNPQNYKYYSLSDQQFPVRERAPSNLSLSGTVPVAPAAPVAQPPKPSLNATPVAPAAPTGSIAPAAAVPQTPVPSPITLPGGGFPPVTIPSGPAIPTTPVQPPVVAQPPVTPQTPVTPPITLPALDGNQFVANPTAGAPGQGAGLTVQDYLAELLDDNSSYIRNAAQRGLEVANSRGLLNSSIAAGASTRAATEAAMPILDQIMGLHGQREGLAFQGEQNQLNRIQGVNDALLGSAIGERRLQAEAQAQANAAKQDFEFRRTLQGDAAAQQDWLRSREFADEFNAGLAMLPVTSSIGMLQALQQYAMNDPEVYTPEIMSGITTFFNNNMMSLLDTYFPGRVQGGNV